MNNKRDAIMADIINSYKNVRGEVILLKNEDDSFGVLRRIMRPVHIGCDKFKFWSYTDLDFATAKYTDCIDVLNGIPSRCKCLFYPKNIRRCKAKQCPKTLGGESYWRFFRETCLYRTR